MLEEAIKGISEAKISGSGVLLATSGSAMTYGALTVSYYDIILGFAGFLLSVFSFYYQYTHNREPRTKHQIISEAIRHFIFGTFAFPAVFGFMVMQFSFPFSINIFISVVLSFSAMEFISVGLSGALTFLSRWIGRK
jgi:hypothetical protein